MVLWLGMKDSFPRSVYISGEISLISSVIFVMKFFVYKCEEFAVLAMLLRDTPGFMSSGPEFNFDVCW
jgi:hypothetical protein